MTTRVEAAAVSHAQATADYMTALEEAGEAYYSSDVEAIERRQDRAWEVYLAAIADETPDPGALRVAMGEAAIAYMEATARTEEEYDALAAYCAALSAWEAAR